MVMVRVGWFASLSVLLLALPASHAGADDDSDLKLGAQVRVTTLASTVAGTLAGLTDLAIALGRNDERVEVPWADVKKLEVMNPGRKAHTVLLTVGGALTGAIGGAAVVVAAAGTSCTPGPCPSDTDWSNAFKTGAIVGAVLGAVGGFATAKFAVGRDPHWEEIENRPRVRINVMPVRGRGVGLAVSLAF
jgi:hypothetical protein